MHICRLFNRFTVAYRSLVVIVKLYKIIKGLSICLGAYIFLIEAISLSFVSS